MQDQIQAKIKEVVELAAEKYGFDVPVNRINITYKSAGQAAGWASRRGSQYSLMFSLESARLDPSEMLNDTVPHEVAHLVCYNQPHLGKNHNPGWARICRGLGGSGNRTHNQKLTKAKYKAQYLYVMPSGREYKASAVMHRKLQAGQVRRFKDGERFAAEYFVRVISSDEHRRAHQAVVQEHARAAQAAPASAVPATPASHKRPERKVKSQAHINRKRVAHGSKLDNCRRLFNSAYSRQENINTFVLTAGCTPAGAATYYAKIKKEQS